MRPDGPSTSALRLLEPAPTGTPPAALRVGPPGRPEPVLGLFNGLSRNFRAGAPAQGGDRRVGGAARGW